MKNFLVLITCIFAFNYYLNAQNFALDLDGVNDKLGVSDAPELNPTGALSVEMWIKIDVWGSSVSSSTLIGKQATSPDRGYAFTVGQSGKVEFSVSINNAWVAATSPSVMGINQWYHVAGVYDGNTVKVYINGILQATNATTGTHNTSTGTAMFLGDNPTWTGRLINGQIDEARIWNVARTQAEIQANYILELTGNEAGLVAYWNFNQGAGTTATDISPNGNNATLLNMDAATDWVQGFIVPVNDIGVLGIASPSMIGPGFTNAETIKIEIKNYTSSNISNFDVSYKINGGTVKTETANVTINPFETYVFTEILKSWWNSIRTPQIFYYRDKDSREIDIIILKDNTIYPVEIKRSATVKSDWARHFEAVSRFSEEKGNGAVICMISEEVPVRTGVTAIPVSYI